MEEASDWSGLTNAPRGGGGPLPASAGDGGRAASPEGRAAARDATIERLRVLLAGAGAPAPETDAPDPAARTAVAGPAAVPFDWDAAGDLPPDGAPADRPDFLADDAVEETWEPQAAGGPGAADEPAPLSDGDYESLARAVVLRQLSGAPKTRAQLAKKLRDKDVPGEIAGRVLDRFAEVALIDDAAFAQAWVSQRSRSRGLARPALRRELHNKGIDKELADSALEQVDPDQEVEAARGLVRKRLAGSTGRVEKDKAVRRLVGMLARKGYPPGLALRIVNEEWPDR